MDAYKALAASYDRLTNDVDYEAVVDFYRKIMEEEGVHPRSAVDLACGTGSVTQLLARQGIPTIGVDLSEDMLTQAQLKTADMDNPPRFICQSLDKLKLYKAVDLAVCALDSLDYITDPRQCRQAIHRIFRALNPGGLFIFDVNTPEKLRAMDGQVFLDEDDDVYCVWRGQFDEETNICSYGMDLFQREGKRWVRSFEEHREYAYSAPQLTGWLREAGFTRIRVYGDRKLSDPEPGEQRIYIKARKGVLK
ncbi:MAG: class I SAM-dependent methyltransferase [Candidatus Faecousia sp.]|nr:class I SAM-dependent methyltransferase [Oscillospiraceae bacterium]MDD6855757.1 class I SAM-dependent methyltransferase [Oscillospiraceae bacterium]MDY2558693.1 class I SAM-dependent methyltransferase [Candidatus Faecousia sp.]